MYLAEVITVSGTRWIYREVPTTQMLTHVLNVGNGIQDKFKESTVHIQNDCVILTLFKEPIAATGPQDWQPTTIKMYGSGMTAELGKELLEKDLACFLEINNNYEISEEKSQKDCCIFKKVEETPSETT